MELHNCQLSKHLIERVYIISCGYIVICPQVLFKLDAADMIYVLLHVH